MSTREGYRWQSRPWSPSDTQARVLDGVARGLTNAQIAAEVGISLDGVKWHISRALAETGLQGRADLALWWQSPRADIDIRLYATAGAMAEASAAPVLEFGFIGPAGAARRPLLLSNQANPAPRLVPGASLTVIQRA
jgi:DNA-binding CsgD family transcriptional regulator